MWKIVATQRRQHQYAEQPLDSWDDIHVGKRARNEHIAFPLDGEDRASSHLEYGVASSSQVYV